MDLVKLIINIDGKEISITPEKAKELQNLLNEMFPTPDTPYIASTNETSTCKFSKF